jgi:glycosyltransferase involved in cell wall biosynthesis
MLTGIAPYLTQGPREFLYPAFVPLQQPFEPADTGQVHPVTTLSVLIPVYNESRTLRTIVGRVLDAPVDLNIEIVAVDDASRDDSLEILRELAAADLRIKVVAQPVNRGKGAAIRTAIDHMTGDIAIVQDADLEYDPSDYPRVLAPILDGRADAVYGSRFAASEQRRVLLFWHSVGNRLLTTLSNMANDLNLTDMETCYKAVRADVLRELRLTSERFGIEPEITARLAQWGARIYEVPISYHGRSYAEGKTIGWRDGVQALWLVFKFRFLDTRFAIEREQLTRQSLGKARRFRRWVMAQFDGYLGNRVLEVMPGPGHTTALLLDRGELVGIDPSRAAVETLRRRYGHLENVEFLHLDPSDPVAAAGLGSDRFDTVVCFDGLQRVDDPKGFLEAVAGPLGPGGHVLIQVPADPALEGPTDRAVGHRRRFTSEELESVIMAVGLRPVFVRPFNRLGRWGWRVHHALGRDHIGGGEARAFSLVVPVAEAIDGFGSGPGLSLIAVAEKP